MYSCPAARALARACPPDNTTVNLPLHNLVTQLSCVLNMGLRLEIHASPL